MKRTILTLICTFFIFVLSIAQDHSSAPKIISTVPVFGDCNVDPELTKIIIKFDQDMSPGYSVPDLKNMPQITGKLEWVDKRTLSIPVKLYPNKLYSLLFNNSRYQNFTNLEGIPLNPEDLHFQTKPVSYEALNKKAYAEFNEIFPKQYSYASIKGVNWKSLLEKNRAELENAKTNTEFALKLVKILRATGDPHLWVDVEGQRLETGKMKLVESNYGSKQLFSLLQDKKISNGFMSMSGVIDSVGYISMREWNTDLNKLSLKPWGDSRNPEVPAEEVLKALFKYPNLIIDVRENSGGNESYAKQFASYFVKDSIPYEKVKSFNQKTGSFDNEHLKKLYPNEKKLSYSGNIYVLSGPSVMSSNESFILMMKQSPKTKVVGMKTYGSSGNPIPHELSNGVIVYLPSWQAYTLDGKLIEGSGIEPDIEIITSKKDFENNDILVDDVLNMIKKKD
jgi:C-terminal processing protease CtpA/Prc